MRVLLLVLACTAACKRAPATPCPFDLGGVWLNASDERYAYRLTDRGAEVTGEFFLRQPDGSETPLADGEQRITLSLRRDGAQLAGIMRSQSPTPAGKQCPVDFALKITR